MRYKYKKEFSKVIKKVPPQGAGYGKRFARKPLVSIASLYFPPQGAGNYTQIIINPLSLFFDFFSKPYQAKDEGRDRVCLFPVSNT